MIPNLLKDRVQIQLKTTSQTALGQTVYWIPQETCHALVRLLDAKARVVYQQLRSEVTHEVVLGKNKTLTLGKHRIKSGAQTLEPVRPPEYRDDLTIIACKEV